MPNGSRWLEWHRARVTGKPVDDYVIDNDGLFYCDHGCANLEEHQQRKSGQTQ